MRVGILAIQHESNTFLSQPTTMDSFRHDALLTGEAIRATYGASFHEVGGFFAALEEAALIAVPLLMACATPCGRITRETAETLIAMALEQLDACGPLDGLLVAPHGAAVSELADDFDGHWLTLIRERLGKQIPIVCTLDPHANVSSRMIAAVNATIAYRTNPHMDQHATGMAAGRLLARTLRGEITPTQAHAAPPVAISIDRQHTSAEPCASLYELANQLQQSRSVLSNSVLLGFPYADVAELGSGFIVVTDNDPALAQRYADQLAQSLIDRRQEFSCGLWEIEAALDQTASLPGPVCLLDVGDNVGGGSPGDGTALARAIELRPLPNSFVCLRDPEAVQAAMAAGAGAQVELAMGGKDDPLQGPPLRAAVRVVSLQEGRFSESQPRHGGRVAYDLGQTAVVTTPAGTTIQLISQRVPPFSLQQLLHFGIDPTQFQAIVAKGVNAPLAAYGEVCREFLRVNTPGVTCADMTQLDFQRRRRPLFPFEEIQPA